MSISNWFEEKFNRLTVFLGIRHQTDTNTMPNSATATAYSQSDDVTNSGSQPVVPPSMVFKTKLTSTSQVPICHPTRVVLNRYLTVYPTRPDDWQDAGKWEQYWNLRVKYPEDFAAADIYIQTFTPLEVEMIMKHVHEVQCFTMSNDDSKIIGDIHLFKRISETRQTLETKLAQNTSMQLEYVKLDYVLETMPGQCYYAFKFSGVDTIYKC